MLPDSAFDGLTDEEKRRLLETYAPAMPSLGPVGRGAAAFSPVTPRAAANALMPDRQPPAPAGVEDDLMRRFAEAQDRGAGNAAFRTLGSRLDNFARVYAGLPEKGDDGAEAVRRTPVQDFLQRQTLANQQRASTRQGELDAVNLAKTKAETERAQASARATSEEAAREAALARVDSPETNAVRESVGALLRGRIPSDVLAGMNGFQLRDAAKLGTSQLNAEALAGSRTESQDLAERRFTLEAELRRQGLGMDAIRLELQRQGLLLDAEKVAQQAKAAEVARETAAGKAVADDTKDIADAFDKSGGPGFYSKYDEVSAMLKKHTGDIPGFGKVDGHVPDMFVSDDALAMRQGVGQMLAEYRKGITGAGMSNAERTEYGAITGLLKSNNERSVRQGVERLRAAMDARVQAMAGGYRPDAVKTYAQRVPSFGRALTGSAVAPPVPTPRVGTRDNPAPSNPSYETLAGQPIPIDELPTATAPKPKAKAAPAPSASSSVKKSSIPAGKIRIRRTDNNTYYFVKPERLKTLQAKNPGLWEQSK